MQGGLVIVASQAWAEAAKSTIDLFFTSPKDSARANIIYACIITILIIFVIFSVNYLSEQSTKITTAVASKFQPTTVKTVEVHDYLDGI
jgi:hypothetical protein